MTNRMNLLMALALAAAWPCAAAAEKTWWLAQDGVGVRAPGVDAVVALPGLLRVGEPHACPPALAVGPHGEALVTSNVVPSVWRIDSATLQVTRHELELDSDHDKDIGFSSLRYSPENGAWLAFSAAHGSTWSIDPALTRATKLAHKPEWRMTCAIN